MRIVVLGSEGQVGRYLVTHARRCGIETTRCDISWDSGHDLRVPYNPLVYDEIRDTDLVYFLAFDVGGSHYLAQRQHSYEYLNDNITIMRNVFAMLRSAQRPFIFASSQMSNMTDSPYGILKRIGEFYTNALRGINVRLWNVYGVEGDDPRKYHVITDLLIAARRGDIALRTDGTESRQFLYGPDCADALLTLGRKHADLDRGLGVYYDITSFEWTTIREIADMIAELHPGTTVTPGDTKDATQTLRNEPNDRILNYWKPTTPLLHGIQAVMHEMSFHVW